MNDPDDRISRRASGAAFVRDEIMIPITYASDRQRAEAILLDAAQTSTADIQKEAEPYRVHLNQTYHLEPVSLAPQVFLRITDNWQASRETKNQMTRAILAGFDAAGIGIASTTLDIVAFPPLRRAKV